MTPLRVGVLSIVQETNTFAPQLSSFEDFASQGVRRGEEVLELLSTNTEAGGALREITSAGAVAVPVLQTWAMSSGPITTSALGRISQLVTEELGRSGPLDGLVLSLHGALVDERGESGDLQLLRLARARTPSHCVIGVCLDLHANLTAALAAECDSLVGYLTYPHVDQGDTGARAARLVVARLTGVAQPVTRIAKRPMLVPAEAQADDGPLGDLRRLGEQMMRDGCMDVSIFPVQPWLDVPELGLGVAVTTDGDAAAAQRGAEQVAARAWDARRRFEAELVPPLQALEQVRATSARPVVLSESSDSPTSGAAGDSPAMIRVLLERGPDLRACLSLVDAPAVDICHSLGEGGRYEGLIGSSVDRRFQPPVHLDGCVARLGAGSFELTGPAFTGMMVSMGRYAVIRSRNLSVLVTEKPAPTFDPEAFRVAGIQLEELDVIVVRSALLFREAYRTIATRALVLDLPGPSTARLATLQYRRVPRPMFPLDGVA